MPLDINDLRADKGGDPEKVRVSEQRRYAKEDTVGKVLELDEEWRRLRTDINEQQKAKGKMSKDIGQRRKKGEDTSADQERVKEISKAIAEMQKRIGEVEQEVQRALSVIGNYVHESVPVHDDEAHNEVVTTWGTPTKPTCTLRHHHELLHMIGGYESERGSRVAGHRAYFLTGPGVLLNQALQQYALAYLTARAYTPVQPPYFMNKDVMAGVAQLSEFNEALYHVSGDSGDMEKYLIATSEQPLCGFHRGDWFQSTDLPKRYAGISTCFRKEAGKSGQDVWGVFRVHQFDKIEQFCITDPESSWAMHEEMRVLAEEFYKTLELPFRVVNIVSAELNNAAAKKYDLEAWFPGYDAYRELVSCSNCTDYQARAMGIRYGQAKDKSDKTARAEHVHMLNSTLCAASRTMCCVLENYQEEDGVRVPKALVPFMGGLTFLPFVREAPVNEEDRKAAKAKARAQSKKQKAPKAKAAKKPAEAAGAGAGAGAGAAEAVVAPTGEAAGTAV